MGKRIFHLRGIQNTRSGNFHKLAHCLRLLDNTLRQRRAKDTSPTVNRYVPAVRVTFECSMGSRRGLTFIYRSA